MTKHKVVNANNPWWTDQLKTLRKQVTALYQKYIFDPIQGNEHKYKKTLRTYKRLCEKERTKNWRLTQECVKTEEEMAQHTKILLNDSQPQVGTLERPDGSFTAVGEETFKELIQTHYPCLLYTSPSPRDKRQSRMPSSA